MLIVMLALRLVSVGVREVFKNKVYFVASIFNILYWLNYTCRSKPNRATNTRNNTSNILNSGSDYVILPCFFFCSN